MQNFERVALSSQLSLRRALDVSANNIANQSTGGFKADRIMFSEYIDPLARGQYGHDSERVRYTFARDSYVDFSTGNIEQTGNPLHAAIIGEGFFAIEVDGEVRYTRDGQFIINPDGQLVNRDGELVMSAGGGTIQIAEGEAGVSIGGDGTVTTSGGSKGRIRVVKFDDTSTLIKLGANLYSSTSEPTDVEDPFIQASSREVSNVNPVLEMVSLIEISRRYTSTAKMMSEVHDLQSRAVRALSGVRG